jgi:hypothetical protein
MSSQDGRKSPVFLFVGRIADQGALKGWYVNSSAHNCYHSCMFNFGKPKTIGDWIIHIAGAVVALFLVWWMLRMYVL